MVCVGQAIQSSEVVWWRSCRCPGCGYAIEEDGVEQISDIRKSILRTEGQWKLFVEVSSHRTRGFAEARQLLELEFVIDKLADIYEPHDARLWLFARQRLLEDQVPAELIQQGRVDEVLASVNQLLDGVHL